MSSGLQPPTRLGIRRAPQKIPKGEEWSIFPNCVSLPKLQSSFESGKKVRVGVSKRSIAAWEGETKVFEVMFTSVKVLDKSKDWETIWITDGSNNQYFIHSSAYKKIRHTIAYYIFKLAKR